MRRSPPIRKPNQGSTTSRPRSPALESGELEPEGSDEPFEPGSTGDVNRRPGGGRRRPHVLPAQSKGKGRWGKIGDVIGDLGDIGQIVWSEAERRQGRKDARRQAQLQRLRAEAARLDAEVTALRSQLKAADEKARGTAKDLQECQVKHGDVPGYG